MSCAASVRARVKVVPRIDIGNGSLKIRLSLAGPAPPGSNIHCYQYSFMRSFTDPSISVRPSRRESLGVGRALDERTG